MVSGQVQPGTFPVYEGMNLIGRDPVCTVQLQGTDKVSQKHALVGTHRESALSWARVRRLVQLLHQNASCAAWSRVDG